jgi:hypothetical protein
MKIKIHKRKYTVVFEPLERTDLLGECNYESAKITISKNLDKPLLYSTIVHELTHAYLFEYGLYDKKYSNENVCNFFGAYGKEIMASAELVYNHYQGNRRR